MWRQHVAVGGTHGKRNAHIISGKAGFPDDQIKLPVAEAIVDRTGGQAYLTRLYGFWLVEKLNKNKRRQVLLKDVETIDLIVNWTSSHRCG